MDKERTLLLAAIKLVRLGGKNGAAVGVKLKARLLRMASFGLSSQPCEKYETPCGTQVEYTCMQQVERDDVCKSLTHRC